MPPLMHVRVLPHGLFRMKRMTPAGGDA
jgi:hypothetical protein